MQLGVIADDVTGGTDLGSVLHPLTPMTDPNLVQVLARQCSVPVGLVPLSDVEAGVTVAGPRGT